MRRLLFVTTTALVLVTFTATGAEAKTVPASEWAPKFCTALSTFEQKISDDASQVSAVLDGEVTSLPQAKTTLAKFMNRAVKDADAVILAVQQAGDPQAPNGAKLEAKFVGAFQTARRLYVEAYKSAKQLPTNTLARFQASTKKLTAKLSAGSKSLGTSFSSVGALDTSGQIGDALRADPSCAFLQGK